MLPARKPPHGSPRRTEPVPDDRPTFAALPAVPNVLRLQRLVGNTATRRLIQRDPQPAEPTAPSFDPSTDTIIDQQDFPALGFSGHTTVVPPGVRVTDTTSGQPAAERLHAGDILLTSNGDMLWGASDLAMKVDAATDGDEFTFRVFTLTGATAPTPGGGRGGGEGGGQGGEQGVDSPHIEDQPQPGEGGILDSAGEGWERVKQGASDLWDQWTGGGDESSGGDGGDSGVFDELWTKRDPAAIIQRDEVQEMPVVPTPRMIVVSLNVNKEDVEPPITKWNSVLPVVGRDAKTKIRKTAQSTVLTNVEKGTVGHVTRGQQRMIEKLRANRAALPAEADKLKMNSYKGDKQAGYMYTGAGSKNIDPTGGGSPKRREVIAQIQAEIGGEGGYSAVNTYDDAVVTLGRGFTRQVLAKVMQQVFAEAPAVREKFMNVGVTWENGTARVVNFENGGIEEGDNALRLLQFDTGVLNLFISLAESEDYGKSIAKAQNDNTDALKVPDSVGNSWTDMNAIRLAAHLIHWRSAVRWSDYARTDGSVLQVLQKAMPVINKASRDASLGNAMVMTEEQTGITRKIGNGCAKGVMGAAITIAPVQDTSLSGFALFKAGGGKYYKVPLS